MGAFIFYTATMAVDFIQRSAGNSASTTLSSSVSNTDTSFPLTSDTAFLAGGGFVIVDEGLATEELAYYTGKSGSALTVPLANRGLEGGSAQAHASGATVKGVFSADMWNNVTEALVNVVSVTTGALDTTKVVDLTTAQTLTTKTLTSPKIGTNIKDTNGNELVILTATGSAVNEITYANAATGNAPSITASGDDTNIDLTLKGKGSGNVKLGTALLKFPNADGSANQALVTNGSGTLSFASAGSTDGWTTDSGTTWTYASATTINVADGTLFQKGDRIKLTQTTAKYFVVTGVSGNVITVTGGTDYSVANAAITTQQYSHQANPLGYPGLFNYTPSLSGITLGNGYLGFRFSLEGKVVHLSGDFRFGSTSSITGQMSFSLPIASASGNNYAGCACTILDSGAAFLPAKMYLDSQTTIALYALNAAGTYLAHTATSSTVPMTWATNDAVTFEVDYTIA